MPKTVTRKYQVYAFKELPEEAQQKAIEKLWDINIQDDWYIDCVGEKQTHLGIEFDMEHACFDLDRGAQFYVDAKHDGGGHTAQIWPAKDFVDNLALPKSLKAKLIPDMFSIGCEHYGGGDGANYIEFQADYDTDVVFTDAEQTAIQEAADALIKQFEAAMLKDLHNQSDYLTSREAIIETIEANDYEFLADGSLFNL